jgi:arginine-tRNA-protein transferase
LSEIGRETPQFYLTAPTACPYLPGKYERKVFTHLVGEKASALNDILTQGGFRRSQNIAYRPACEACKACVSVRVRVDEFMPSRSFRRVSKRNADLIGEDVSPQPSADQYALFRDYLDSRHAEGGMAEMTVLDYAMMVEDTHVETRVIEYRRRGIDSALTGRGRGPLLGVALTDVLSDGLSMVYSFFDPAMSRHSLGNLLILDHISQVKMAGLSYVYLGYWVKDSPKMAYKGQFRPLEVQSGPLGWRRLDTGAKPG